LNALKQIQLSNLKLKKTPLVHRRAGDVDLMLSQTKSFKKGLNIELELSKRCDKQLDHHTDLDSRTSNMILDYELSKIMAHDDALTEFVYKAEKKKTNDELPILNKIITNQNLI
jgi:hypothetical protein